MVIVWEFIRFEVELRFERTRVLAMRVQVGVDDILVPVTVAQVAEVHVWDTVVGKSILILPVVLSPSVIVIENV